MFVERESRMGEIKAAEARAAINMKVAREQRSLKTRSLTTFVSMPLGLSRTVSRRDTDDASWIQTTRKSWPCFRWTRGRRHARPK